MNRFFSKYTINKNVIVFVILSFVSFIIFYIDSGSKYNLTAITQFFIVALLSLYGVFLSIDKWSFSLNKTYHIFTYFFLAVAPVIQFKNKVGFYEANSIEDNIYQKLGLILILIQILYLFIYHIVISYLKKVKWKKSNMKVIENNQLDYIIISSLSFLFFLILINYDVDIVFKRPPPNDWQKNNTNFGLFGYALLLIIRAIPIIVLLLYNYTYTNKRFNIILIFLAILTAFPLSLSRGTMVAFYLPLIITFVPLMKRHLVYSLSFFFGVFLIFPVLNFFRIRKNTIYLGESLFTSAHLDAFYNFAQLYTIGIITNGRQLLGSVFFFVQESMWPGRPVGTGRMMAQVKNYNYTNVSMPYWGEGYANFGLWGVIIFLILLVAFNAIYDYAFNNLKINIYYKIIFLFFLGFEFYLLRGDLYSSINKLSSFILGIILIQFAFFFLNKFRRRVM